LTVQRIVGLVTRLTEASRSAITLRALANVAAGTLAELFPKSSVVVFKRDRSEPLAHVIGGANLPRGWQTRVVRLADVPLLDEALRCPERISVRSAYRCRRKDTGVAEIVGGLQTFCAAVPDSGGPLYALMLLVPPAPSETEVCESAIEITRQLLARSSVNPGSRRGRILAAIHRAKLEWEHTADALPEIVGLLDSSWQVVRVSRALERWQLGSVEGAIGRGLHSLLHTSCTDSDCVLSAAVERAMRELSRAPHACFELADPVLSLDLDVALTAPRTVDGQINKSQRIVFTVANVTSLRKAERELKSLNHSLEQRVEERTSEILATNHSLRREIERRRSAEKSLRRSTRDLEALSERLMNAQEAERKRISQDMHDSVGQMLSAIKYSLERAELLSRQEAHDET
jgi:PAS domain-containing protein